MFKRFTPILIPLLAVPMALSACRTADNTKTAEEETVSEEALTDFSGIHSYLLGKTAELAAETTSLEEAAQSYYRLAESADFDYQRLWQSNPAEVKATLAQAKDSWISASPLYEQVEGIVAGTPSLANYDVILDAGTSVDEDPQNAVPFDLVLTDGRVLRQPGNLFGVTEATLWGTESAYSSGVEVDLDGDGETGFGEVLPEANVLLAGAETLKQYAQELDQASAAWQPTESDAFTALVVMVPTMSEYFNSWKNSRFVLGEESSQRDFVVISRLADIQDILSSLQVVYAGIEPLAQTADADLAAQVEREMTNLKAYVADVYAQEQEGKIFTPEEADLLGAEAQERATAIVGDVSQLAALLNITIAE